MPRRPRSHELETESRRAFEALLPSSWVVRRVDEEYGIDLEVEIFQGGEATGSVFRVQLKATDKLPKNGRISRGDIKVETLTYWRTLDLPVLVVLYVAPHRRLYARWAHSYDPHYARSPNAKTVTFAFDRRHQLSKEQHEILATHVQLIRAIKKRELGYPMPLSLKGAAGVHGHPEEAVRVSIRRAINVSQGLLTVSDDENFSATVTLDNTSLCVTLPADIASATFHYTEPDLYAGPNGLKSLAADTMMAAASLFLRIGETRAAVEIVELFYADSYIIRMPGGMALFAEDFVANDYVSQAFRLVKDVIDSPVEEIRGLAQIVLVHIFVHRGPGRLTGEEFREMLGCLERRALLELAEGDRTAAGRTFYTIGEHYRGIDEWEKSLVAFNEALAYDPSYSNRGYFWRARGALHYELRKYDEAAVDYKEAVRCGDSPEAAFLLSDVLMRAGRYGEASAVPATAEASAYYALGERIQRSVIWTICEVTGLANQARTPADSERVESIARSEGTAQVVAALRETDAIDPRLWYILGMQEADSDVDRASAAWLVAADLERTNPRLWALAASYAILYRSEKFANDVCDSAIKWCDDEFLRAADELIVMFPGDAASAIRSKVYERADRDRPRAPRTVRIVNDEGAYEAIDLSG
ncbi:DUF4365 domain-containing protein [Micromonospora haikouensis]|uniref:DUF4365 domain-containing protein n=1 Tax=Micromonospora haikouensis TaxID=686309 RepID=UPI003D715B9F